MTLTDPFKHAPEHVWHQVAALDEIHAERVAAEAARPLPEPEPPPADSEPEVAKAAIAELEAELQATPLHDETLREHLEGDLSYYQDLLDFHRDDWRAIHAQRAEAERVALAAERKAAREAQVHPEPEPTGTTTPTPRQRDRHLLRRKQHGSD